METPWCSAHGGSDRSHRQLDSADHWNGRKRCLSEVRAGEDDPHDSKMGWNMMNGKHGAATLWMVATRKNTSAASCSHVP